MNGWRWRVLGGLCQVFLELVDTERTYVRDLSLLVNGLLVPLRRSLRESQESTCRFLPPSLRAWQPLPHGLTVIRLRARADIVGGADQGAVHECGGSPQASQGPAPPRRVDYAVVRYVLLPMVMFLERWCRGFVFCLFWFWFGLVWFFFFFCYYYLAGSRPPLQVRRVSCVCRERA